jgi:hypothetical protein
MVAVVAGGPSTGTSGGLDPVGVALALSAALSQAVFVLVSQHGYRAVPTDQAMATILAVSAVVAGGLALAVGGPAALTLPFSVPPDLLGLLLFGGIFGAAVPSFLFLAGIRWIGPVRPDPHARRAARRRCAGSRLPGRGHRPIRRGRPGDPRRGGHHPARPAGEPASSRQRSRSPRDRCGATRSRSAPPATRS